MRISHGALPILRTVVLVAFLAANVFIVGYFYAGAGGSIPLISPHDYKLSFEVPTAHNLVPGSHATLAGVISGRVDSIRARPDGRADAVMSIDRGAPLHQGARLELREKSLLGETYVDITDGTGAPIENGGAIPPSRVTPAVNLDDILQKMDAPRRAELAGFLNSLGKGTKDSNQAISDGLSGLGQLSREGRTALQALTDQKQSLAELSGNMAAVLRALDTRRGQIADLVSSARIVTDATARTDTQLRSTMNELPGVLTTARDASDDLTRLGDHLQPVAANVNAAAPALRSALKELPDTTSELRGTMAPLYRTLDKSPRTFSRVGRFADDLSDLLPNARKDLASLNPMLGYLRPYGRDMATFFTNFGLTPHPNIDGNNEFRVMPLFVKDSLKNSPVSLQQGPFNTSHPYQRPGQQQKNPGGGDRRPHVR